MALPTTDVIVDADEVLQQLADAIANNERFATQRACDLLYAHLIHGGLPPTWTAHEGAWLYYRGYCVGRNRR